LLGIVAVTGIAPPATISTGMNLAAPSRAATYDLSNVAAVGIELLQPWKIANFGGDHCTRELISEKVYVS
jgi:hypothetical protein